MNSYGSTIHLQKGPMSKVTKVLGGSPQKCNQNEQRNLQGSEETTCKHKCFVLIVFLIVAIQRASGD